MPPSLQSIREAVKKRKAKTETAPARKKTALNIPGRNEAEETSKRAEAPRAGAPELPSVEGRIAEEHVLNLPAVSSSPVDLTRSSPDQRPDEPLLLTTPEVAPTIAAPEVTSAVPSPDRERTRETPPTTMTPRNLASSSAPPAPTPEEMDFSLQTILNQHGRWAERTMGQSNVPGIQRFLHSQRASTFFRELSASLLWASNSVTAMKSVLSRAESTLDRAREEAQEARSRAEKAEAALESAQSEATEARRAAADAESARLNYATRADEAEKKLKIADSEIFLLTNRLHLANIETRAAEERAENAEEIARRSDIEATALKAALSEAEERADSANAKITNLQMTLTEAEKKAIEAVDNFKKSADFEKEIAESVAFAYEGGFRDCKERVKQLGDFEGVDDLEPDGSEEENLNPSDM